jgi:hypothetical protein
LIRERLLGGHSSCGANGSYVPFPVIGAFSLTSVSRIVLVPLHLGLHISRRHQSNLMAKRPNLACPVMRGRPCFHADQTGRLVFTQRQHLPSPQLALDNNVPGLVDAVHLEHVLRDVQTNRANPFHGWFLLGGSSNDAASLAHRNAGGGAVHSIKFEEVKYATSVSSSRGSTIHGKD